MTTAQLKQARDEAHRAYVGLAEIFGHSQCLSAWNRLVDADAKYIAATR